MKNMNITPRKLNPHRPLLVPTSAIGKIVIFTNRGLICFREFERGYRSEWEEKAGLALSTVVIYIQDARTYGGMINKEKRELQHFAVRAAEIVGRIA